MGALPEPLRGSPGMTTKVLVAGEAEGAIFLKRSGAIAHGRLWEMSDMVKVLEDWEAARAER
jgi:hypothetical protein